MSTINLTVAIILVALIILVITVLLKAVRIIPRLALESLNVWVSTTQH